MSQNMIGFAKKYNGEWYVFPEEAEICVSETSFIPPEAYDSNGEVDWEKVDWDKVVELPQVEWKRNLEITSPNTLGPYATLEQALSQAESDFDELFGYFEYGIVLSDNFDGVRLVLTFKGVEAVE